MGHLAGKDIYGRLADKIDGLSMRIPKDEKLYPILKELYGSDEAELVVSMPYGMTTVEQLRGATGKSADELKRLLDGLCDKGLVFDMAVDGQYYYSPSPMVIGIYEFTMMRAGADSKKLAGLFHEYLNRPDFYAANMRPDDQISIMRALPHESVVMQAEHIEILDYERATAIVESAGRFSVGLCSCRHEKEHVGEKTCDVPLEKCSSFGYAAEYLIRHGLAREASKTEMLENLAQSKEMGLVLNADNVQKNVTYICHCCGCCCHALLGISRFGYPNAIVTSSFIAETDRGLCNGCGKCALACPIKAIAMNPEPEGAKPGKRPSVDKSICLGCGVCALGCKTGALKLIKRGQRVIHPETTFERIILQCLEKGTLQNQLLGDPNSITQSALRGIVGGFLRLSPVKRALMSDALRSRFLGAMKAGARMQGQGWAVEL